MNKLNLALLALLMISCVKLVGVSHEARQLFSAVDRAERQQKQLDAEYRRLDAERQTQATHQKVERVARQRLHMHEPALTVYLDAPPAFAAAPVNPVSAVTPSTPGSSVSAASPSAPATRVAQTGPGVLHPDRVAR